MSWFYFALAAPLLFALTTLLDDNLLKYVYKSPQFATVSAGVYGTLPLLSRLFLPASNIPFSLALLAVLAGIFNLIYYFFYFRGLQSDTPSIVLVLFTLAPATLPFLAHATVHENLVKLQLVGFILI